MMKNNLVKFVVDRQNDLIPKDTSFCTSLEPTPEHPPGSRYTPKEIIVHPARTMIRKRT